MDEKLVKELNKNIEELIRLNKFNQKVFNAREAADYLRIGYYTMLQLTRIGQIEYIPNGTNYLYKIEALDRWLDKNKKFAQ